MNLNYSDDQSMLRDSVEKFLSERYPFEHFRKKVASPTPFDAEIWRNFAELGWLALPISEQHGGLGGGAVETAIIAEMLGRSLVVEPFISAAVLAGSLVDRLGSDAQCEALLGPLLEGRGWTALAHAERGAGSDMSRMTAVAARVGKGYRLTANKTTVLGGPLAETFLVTARTDDRSQGQQGMGVFIVPATAAGVDVRPFRTADGSQAADVDLNGVVVGANALLGSDDDAAEAVEHAVDQATAAICWDAVGSMDALLSATIAFTRQRVQFGKPLSTFQALQHRIAEMGVKCGEARAIALLASLSLDARKELRIRGVSGAKAKIGKVSRLVAQEAIQLHGAIGFTDELPVGWWFKRLFVFENLLGSTSQHLARYAAVVKQPSIQAESLLRSPATL